MPQGRRSRRDDGTRLAVPSSTPRSTILRLFSKSWCMAADAFRRTSIMSRSRSRAEQAMRSCRNLLCRAGIQCRQLSVRRSARNGACKGAVPFYSCQAWSQDWRTISWLILRIRSSRGSWRAYINRFSGTAVCSVPSPRQAPLFAPTSWRRFKPCQIFAL